MGPNIAPVVLESSRRKCESVLSQSNIVAAITIDFDYDFKESVPVHCEEQQLQDMAGMDLMAIIRRTFKMLKENRSIFMWIHISMVVPLMACTFLYFTTLLTFLPSLEEGSEVGPLDPRTITLDVLDIVKLGFIFVLFLIMITLGSSFTTAISYTVGHLHHGETITMSEVFKALPRLREGLRSTQAWGTLLSLPALPIVFALGYYGSMYIFTRFSGEESFSFPWIMKTEVLLFLVIFVSFSPYFTFQMTLLQMARCVACLEGTHGLAAIKKGWSLLKGRWRIALGLSYILILPQFLAIVLASPAVYSLIESDMKDAFVMHYLSWLVLMILLMAATGMAHISLVTQALFYISCKAFHHESSDMDSLNQLRPGYEPIGRSMPSDDEASPV